MKKILYLISIPVILFSSCKKEDKKAPYVPPVVYNNVRVLSVKVLAMPFVRPDGTSWDVSDGPDLALGVLVGSTPVTVGSTGYNVKPSDIPVSWNWPTPIEVKNFTTVYTFVLMDDDDDSYEYIGWGDIIFDPLTSTYPSVWPLTLSSGVKLELSLKWY